MRERNVGGTCYLEVWIIKSVGYSGSKREIFECMQSQAKGIQSVTKQLPPSVPMKQATAKSIGVASAKNDLDRFAPKRACRSVGRSIVQPLIT
jgi:hypothetical protein